MFGDQPQREPIPKEIRDQVREKFGGHCAYCGILLKQKGWHVDHVIPVAAGGIDDISNFFPACSICNQFKNSSSLEQFKTILEEQTYKKAAFILAARFLQITAHPTKIEFWYEKQGHVFDEELVRELMKNPALRPNQFTES